MLQGSLVCSVESVLAFLVWVVLTVSPSDVAPHASSSSKAVDGAGAVPQVSILSGPEEREAEEAEETESEERN